ncbi:MAG: lysophospholipid acyltransferase family protein [Rhodocyclaceae bacterium]
MISRAVAYLLIFIARVVTGAQARWNERTPCSGQRIYFANHSSHLDFLLLWAMLPAHLRWRTRPVAGADYWNASAVRRYLIHKVFRGVLIERRGREEGCDPLAPVVAALGQGDSLIFFPEGTRNAEPEMLPFKSGLYHLAQQCPQIELVPARIENLNRVMPKGELIPLPLICTITFGAAVGLVSGEDKGDFLSRARQSIIDLALAPA